MKKFFSLVLALVMALSLTTVAWGATVTDEAGLNAAIASGEVVLGGDVEITTTIRISNTVTVDLAGYKLTGPDDGSANWYAFVVEDGGKLTLKDSSAAQTGVLFAKCYGVETKGGTFVMESGKIDATTNGGIGAAIVNYGGTVIVNGGNLVASNWAVNAQSYFAAAAVEINGGTLETTSTTEAAVQVGGEYSQNTETVAVNGGEIEGDVALSVDSATADVTVAGGSIDGDVAASAGDLAVSGGSFTDNVSDYVAAGYTMVGGEIVKASNSYTGLYAGATSEGANVVAITSLNFFKANDNEVNEDGTYKADGNVAYYTVTGDQYFTGKYYVEVKTLAAADVVVSTDTAGKNVYMYLDQIEDPFYYGDGVMTKNFGTACGQYNAKNAAYDKKATYYVAFETLYVGDKVSPSEWLMVNGEMVGVDVAFNDVVAHAPVYTRDENSKIVAIKCSKCGAVAVEAPNFLSMPKNADRVGNTLWYFPAAGAVGDTETKVESAETFDAGIAMYVGMSVMAAAGSAVVIGKKKD